MPVTGSIFIHKNALIYQSSYPSSGEGQQWSIIFVLDKLASINCLILVKHHNLLRLNQFSTMFTLERVLKD